MMTLFTVAVVLAAVSKVPPEAPTVMPRLLSSIVRVAVVTSVPPLKVSWSEVPAPGFAPRFVSLEMDSLPALMTVLPVYVLAPLSTQVPVPVFTTPVVFVPLLSTMAPLISPEPAVDPCKVSTFAPAPEAVRSLVILSKPVPDWSIVPPPVVPARSITRSVVSPPPV